MTYLVFIVLIIAIILVVVFRPRCGPLILSYAPETANYIKPQVIDNLVTPDEARYILDQALPEMEISSIMGGQNESVRKSKTAWLRKSDPKIRSIFDRLSKQFHFDVRNAEDLQVVEYLPGGFYNEHHDGCCDNNDHCRDFAKKSGQRVLTILVYLNDDFEDGETSFPNLGISVKANKYGGVVFRPLEEGGNRCHPSALHKGTQVTSGVKYICNIWVRERPFST